MANGNGNKISSYVEYSDSQELQAFRAELDEKDALERQAQQEKDQQCKQDFTSTDDPELQAFLKESKQASQKGEAETTKSPHRRKYQPSREPENLQTKQKAADFAKQFEGMLGDGLNKNSSQENQKGNANRPRPR